MKAILFENYGSPDILQCKEVEKPVPKANEVLVKIHAASANPLDWHRMRADPFIVRFSQGFAKPNDPRIGADVAGVVEAIGADVVHFKPGDAVFGEIGAGAFAEYVAVEERKVTHMPASMSFEEAAAMPVVGFTAIQGLRDTGNIQAGEKVLINGASGGVGTYALQYAKSIGAEVTAVCSGRNFELVKSLGADHVIDYTKEDFTRVSQKFDLVYDAVGNRSPFAYARALKPGGRCVIAGFTTLGWMLRLAIFTPFAARDGKKIGMMGTAQPNPEDLLLIANLLESGEVNAVIDRRYSLEESAEAIRYLETGRARGKVIVTVV